VINGDLFCSTKRLAALLRRPESIASYRALQSLAGQAGERILASPLARHMPDVARAEWSIIASLVDPEALSYYVSGEGAAYGGGARHGWHPGGHHVPGLARLWCPIPRRGHVPKDAEYACDRLVNPRHIHLAGVGHDLGLFTARSAPWIEAIPRFVDSLWTGGND
jgi:hypothetical protein